MVSALYQCLNTIEPEVLAALERAKLLILSMILATGYLVTSLLSAPPGLSGLSTILGMTVFVNSGPIFAALDSLQLYASVSLIGLLVFLELTDPAYGETKSFLLKLRTNWLPHTIFLLVVFSLIVAFKVATILLAV
jgi:hypothetical protein